jgi:hypothetical protein
MRHDDTPLRNQLLDLEVEEQAAGERYQVAKRRQSGDAYRRAEDEVLAEIRAFRDDCDYKRREREAPPKERATMREITERIAGAVLDRGLAFAPTFGEIRGVMIVDPSIDAHAEVAEYEAREATRAVKDFIRENATAMEEESRRANDAEFKAAIDAGDTEAVRGILGLKDKTESGAMTTADLPN